MGESNRKRARAQQAETLDAFVEIQVCKHWNLILVPTPGTSLDLVRTISDSTLGRQRSIIGRVTTSQDKRFILETHTEIRQWMLGTLIEGFLSSGIMCGVIRDKICDDRTECIVLSPNIGSARV